VIFNKKIPNHKSILTIDPLIGEINGQNIGDIIEI